MPVHYEKKYCMAHCSAESVLIEQLHTHASTTHACSCTSGTPFVCEMKDKKRDGIQNQRPEFILLFCKSTVHTSQCQNVTNTGASSRGSSTCSPIDRCSHPLQLCILSFEVIHIHDFCDFLFFDFVPLTSCRSSTSSGVLVWRP